MPDHRVCLHAGDADGLLDSEKSVFLSVWVQ